MGAEATLPFSIWGPLGAFCIILMGAIVVLYRDNRAKDRRYQKTTEEHAESLKKLNEKHADDLKAWEERHVAKAESWMEKFHEIAKPLTTLTEVLIRRSGGRG